LLERPQACESNRRYRPTAAVDLCTANGSNASAQRPLRAVRAARLTLRNARRSDRVDRRRANRSCCNLASLGPGQRFASKGSYIVEAEGADNTQLKPVSAWIVP
jgi:hypothetical protein